MDGPTGIVSDGDYVASDAATDRNRVGLRESMLLMAEIRRPGEPAVALRMRNLSSRGLMGECALTLAADEPVEVALRGSGIIAARVAWVRQGRIGLAFAVEIDPQRVRNPTRSPAPGAITLLRPVKAARRPGLTID